MTTLIPIQSAAMFHVDHVRSLIVVGARSSFHSGLAETSLRNSSKSRCVTAMSDVLTESVAKCGLLFEPEADRDARLHRNHARRDC